MTFRCTDIVRREFKRVLDHPFDFLIRQSVRRFDLDGLRLSGPHIFGHNVENAVGIDEEGHFDPGPRRQWRNLETKAARLRLSFASSRSPWRMWMSTPVWPST